MEKVLRGSDDGILVYVAPTKALVTQIAAEVYARFKKEVTGGLSVICRSYHTLMTTARELLGDTHARLSYT